MNQSMLLPRFTWMKRLGSQRSSQGGLVTSVFGLLLLSGCANSASVSVGGKTAADAPKEAPRAAGAAMPTGLGMPTPEKGAPAAEMSAAAKESYGRGWQAFYMGDLAAARDEFRTAAKRDPKAGAAIFAAGVMMERLGDVAGAQKEYQAAFAAQPEFDTAMCAYASSLAALGRVADAENFLTDRRKKLPNSARLLACHAELKSLSKDSAGCQSLAQEALRIDPEFTAAMVVIARDHYRGHRVELARYALQAILDGFGPETPARDKGNGEALLLRGLIEREQGRRGLAMVSFEGAKAARPDMVEALINLGVMKLEAGNASDAIPVLSAATRYAPANAVAHLNLGDAFRLNGKADDAKREFEKALTLDSSLSMAHYDMGLLYLFSPTMAGLSEASQADLAVKELETFKSMRGPKALPGTVDDVDELLNRGKAKQAEIRNRAAAASGAGDTAGTGEKK